MPKAYDWRPRLECRKARLGHYEMLVLLALYG